MSEEQKAGSSRADKILFWGCFISLIATAFAFVVRTMIISELGVEFNLTETQKGEILGVGLWPFAVSIILFSLIIDKIGYGRAMVFAFVCHVASTVLTIFATGYETLYAATFIMALGNGTVEAVINPVVATMFKKEKTKWLNILHAGWPGGMLVGGIFAIILQQAGVDNWQVLVGLIFIPTLIYGVMLVGRKFPVHERVASGVSYQAMLQEVGIIGALIAVSLVTAEVGRYLHFPTMLQVGIIVVLTGAYGAYVKSLGKPLFIFLLLIMMPLATTELGTDSWITPLMKGEVNNPVTVLLYTSFIMMILRFFAGPIVHRISPLGLLTVSSVIAIAGLFFLSQAAGMVIFVAATLYAFGKAFFWPTTLGVVAEQFPKGGAMTMNTIAGVGMLAVGTVGAPFLGYIQDTSIADKLEAEQPALFEQYSHEKDGLLGFGTITALDGDAAAEANEEDAATINTIRGQAKKDALKTVTVFPAVMLVCYIILIIYFRSKGGYQIQEIELDEPGPVEY